MILKVNLKKGCLVLVKVGQRKERSDKKKEIKPLIPSEAKEYITRLSHITDKPIKDICEYLVVFALKDKQTFDTLTIYFKRSFFIDPTYYNGHLDAPSIEKRLKGPTEKVSIKFKKEDYELISTLAYALDCTPTRATAILLEMAAHNIKAVNEYVHKYLVDELTESQMRNLRKVLSYVNRYSNENSSWLTVLSTVVGDVRPSTIKLHDLVAEFLNVTKAKNPKR